MKSKKAQGLTLNTVIVAILVLIVLVVLVVILVTQVNITRTGINETQSSFAKCKAPGLGRECVPMGTCNGVEFDGKFSDCNIAEVCCSG